MNDKKINLLKKKLSKRDYWFLWEIHSLIQKEFKVNYSMGYLHTFLKTNFKIKFGKHYRHDYRQKFNYKNNIL